MSSGDQRPWKQDMPAQWYVDYDRGRPGWPGEILDVAQLASESSVLDLGAGPGRLTQLLLPRFRHVIAVEPDEAMLSLLRFNCDEAEVLVGSADAIPLPNEAVDAVFVAQAFHWFNNEQALGEIARVLRPRGALVLMWNIPAGRTEPSINAVVELLDECGLKIGDEARDMDPWRLGQLSEDWRDTFAASLFDELREVRLPNLQTVDADGIVAFFASMGWIANLPNSDSSRVLDEMRSRLRAAEYRVPWETVLYWTRSSG